MGRGMANGAQSATEGDRAWFKTAFRSIRGAIGELLLASLAINLLTFAVNGSAARPTPLPRTWSAARPPSAITTSARRST